MSCDGCDDALVGLALGAQDTSQRRLRARRLELTRVGDVRHERERLARRDHALEEARELVGVRIVEEAIGVVGEGLGADPDAREVRQLRGEQRLDVAAEDVRPHHERVASREEHARHFGMLLEVRDEALGLARRERVEPHELGPAEAIRAVGVAV